MTEVVVYDIDAASAIQKLAQLRADTNALKEAQKQLAVEVQKGNKEAATSYEANAIILKNLSNEQRNLSRQVEGYSEVQRKATDTVNFANNSIQQNRELLKQLTAQYINLKNPSVEATNQIKTLSDTLKQQESAIGDNRREVGNYQKALLNATADIKIFGVSIGQLQSTYNDYNETLVSARKDLSAYITGQKAADGANKLSIVSTAGLSAAIRVLRLALISTGIGAFVVLLGSLVTALATTQKGVDLVEDAMAALSGIFQSTLGVVQRLGNDLIDIFSNPKKAITDLVTFLQGNLLNRLKAFGVIIDGIVNFDTKKVTNGVAQLATGVTNLTDKLENAAAKTGKFLSDAAKRGQQIVAIEREIEDLEAQINKRRAENATRETELLIIAKSVNSTQKERKAATDEILKNTADLQKLEEDIVKKKIEALKLSQSQNDTDRAGNKQLFDLEAELIKVQASGKEKQLSLIKLLNKEQKEQTKAIKETTQATIDYQKIATENQQKFIDEFLTGVEKELELLDLQQEGRREFLEQSGLTDAEITERFREERLKVLDEYAQKEIDQNKKRADEQLDIDKKNADDQIQLQKQLNDAIAEIQNQRIEILAASANFINTIAGESQVATAFALLLQKSAAIADIIINTQREISAYNANPAWSLLPDGGTAIKTTFATQAKIKAGIAIGTIAAQTIQQLTPPKNQIEPPQFEQGGEIEIGGKSHSQGGVQLALDGKPVAEVEQGEGLFVMKKNAYQAIKHYSNINKAFGGKSWNTTSSFLQDGGAINTTLPRQTARIRVNEQIQQNREIVRALSAMPAPELSIVELNKKTAKRNKSVRVSEL